MTFTKYQRIILPLLGILVVIVGLAGAVGWL